MIIIFGWTIPLFEFLEVRMVLNIILNVFMDKADPTPVQQNLLF